MKQIAEQTSRNIQKPSASGNTAAKYTYEMMQYHQAQYPDKQPSKFELWVGNGALAVLPQNRLGSAVGLTLGQIVGGAIASTAVGYTLLNGAKVEKAPMGLGWLHKIVKNYDPKGIGGRDKMIRQAAIAVFSLGGLFGVKLASDWVYSGAVEKAKNPHYLEDYLTRVSHHEGETWGWLSASSAIWGSASGMPFVPIPGLNYALGMMARIVTMQNRNSTMPWLNEITSDATTTSYMRLREGSNYLCEYAAGNTSPEPTQIEFLAYTILGPLFKDKLTAEHIKTFADTVQAVRAPFMPKNGEQGGIPKNLRKEAVTALKEVFTGAGLEVLLIDMGLNPATIAFNKVHGLIGRIGDIGQKENIQKEQNEFWAALQERLPKYVAAGEISQERADWVVAGIDAMKQGKPAQTLPEPEKETFIEPSKPELENAIANSEIKIHNITPISRHDRFTSTSVGMGAIQIRQNSIRNLIADAQKDGNWGEGVLHQRQNMEASPMAVE